MKVCFISPEYPPMQGGMGDYTRALGRALTELGIKAHVVTSAAADQSEHAAEPGDGCVVRPVVEGWGWRSLRTIEKLVTSLQPAIVHIQYQAAGYGMHPAINFLPLWLRWRRPEIPTAITYHDLRVPYLFPKAGLVRWWVTLAPARWSHAVVVTNAEDLRRLEVTNEGSGVDRVSQALISNLQSLFLVPIGSNIHPAPPADFDPETWRAQIGVRRDETMLIYFGFLNTSKGGETLIRGLERLTRAGYNCRLVMLGGSVGASDPTNRAYLAKVTALIDELELEDRVLWTGFVPAEEVSAYLMAADMAVLPYRDGVSFRRGSLVAALAHGVPVVTTHPRTTKTPGGLPRLVDGVNARLVPPDDADALARAISDLIDEPLRRRQLGALARELSKAFAWDKIARKHRAIYDQLADRRSEPGEPASSS